MYICKYTLENTEGAIKKGQSRVTGNKSKKNKAQHGMCWTLLYATNANNVNKTCALLQTTWSKD